MKSRFGKFDSSERHLLIQEIGLAHFVSVTMPMSSPAAQLAEFKGRVFGVRSECSRAATSGTTS